MNLPEKFLVEFYSEPSFLALSILENLLANNCFVNIITNDVKTWTDKTINIAVKTKFSINSKDSYLSNTSTRYIILCVGFIDNLKPLSEVMAFLRYNNNIKDKKTFIILPKEIHSTFTNTIFDLNENTGRIFVGDLLGPRIDLDSNLKLTRYIREILSKRSVTFPVGEVLYPVFVSDVARQIVKWLFAFGPFGRDTFIVGPDTSPNYFWQINTKLVGDIKYLTDPDLKTDTLPRGSNIFRMQKELIYMLTETYKWIKSVPVRIQPPKKVIAKQQKTILNEKPKKTLKKPLLNMKYVWIGVLVVLLFPIVNSLVATGISYASYLNIKSGNENTAVNLLRIGKNISYPSYFESTVFKNIPFFGQIYKETEYISYSIISASDVVDDALSLNRKGKELIGLVLGDSPYSISTTTDGTTDLLQTIYNQLSNFEKESIEKKKNGSLLAGILLSKFGIGHYKQLISQVIIVVEKLPEALGEKESKTYLILFQNNMELRPTGGFIGSYGLLTFDGGRLSDFAISDVYSADGQLKGHVEPPAPIKKYLNEANWWLRDSNWDPDFPTSAKRAEWFLDKEMNRSVDGVISLDLYPVKDFLRITGPTFLADYNMQITSENIYEKVQSEVHENFFPGTYKKTSFLTALSRSILEQLGSLSSNQSTKMLKIAYDSFNERHIQVFLHNMDLQRAINNLGWDGSVFTPTCVDTCYSDLIGIVEANVGVNKSNYFIKRSVEVSIEVEGGASKKDLILTLQNSANPSLGISGRYKSYIRALVPQGAKNIQVYESFGQNSKALTPEITDAKGRMEIGIITEVLAGETKKIEYSWDNSTEKSIDQYNVYFRKQAGVEKYPVSIKVYSKNRIISSNPVFTLTNEGGYLYNTTLVRDLFATLSF